ncbi:PAS-domain containing protein [Breoghania sp.]|uniref:PAS-domain containing protein n=1 Tax=Breoghania sp. TaxID=2065378 RepID=UPI002632C179|nr:PAS-domain containing protein [Breoghania sp.]MDJ0931485.1 PAS-domain containing protein [Breoghania sp.]
MLDYADVSDPEELRDALRAEIARRRQAEALLWDIVETLPEGIAAFDGDDRLLVYNSAYLDTFHALGDLVEVGASFEAILRNAVESVDFVLPCEGEVDREAWIEQRLEEHRTPGRLSV